MKRAYWVAGALALAVVLLLLSGAIGSPPRGNPPAAAVPMSPQIVEWLPRLQGPPAISGELKVEPYRLVRLKVDQLPARAGVLWSVYPPGKADIAHTSDRCCLEFVAPPGSYGVELLVIALDESGVPVPWKTTVTVVIGSEPGPGPVPPGPGPGPTPPVPPVDPLQSVLQGAYNRDPPDCAGVPKSQCKAKLVRLYTAGLNSDLTKYRTAGDLFTALKGMAVQVELPSTALTNLRTAIGGEMRQILPTDATTVLTQDHRANTLSFFRRLIKVLEVLE